MSDYVLVEWAESLYYGDLDPDNNIRHGVNLLIIMPDNGRAALALVRKMITEIDAIDEAPSGRYMPAGGIWLSPWREKWYESVLWIHPQAWPKIRQALVDAGFKVGGPPEDWTPNSRLQLWLAKWLKRVFFPFGRLS
jgi:hypothetical protein